MLNTGRCGYGATGVGGVGRAHFEAIRGVDTNPFAARRWLSGADAGVDDACQGREARRSQWWERIVPSRLPFCALLCACLLGGCAMMPRRPPPPTLVNHASPNGFAPDIRMLTVDRKEFLQRLPRWLHGLEAAAGGRPINIMVLSGGGAYGAFGAGALIGMSHAGSRPEFQLVTGVSAGALLAPFAFLGPAWDRQLQHVFTAGAIERLQPSLVWGTIGRVMFPQGPRNGDALATIVNETFTDQLIEAVATKAAAGNLLVVATTDLDNQETMLWNMGAIAQRGGVAAYKLFRAVLTASASVPGVFPPVLIGVQEGGRLYDEMHVDGGVTTPLFIAPMVARVSPDLGTEPGNGNVYVIVNGAPAVRPEEVSINTFKVLQTSLAAGLTYRTRDALGTIMELSRRNQMKLHVTYMPTAYPAGSFLDFRGEHLRGLFQYGEHCAAQARLWTSIATFLDRNIYQPADTRASAEACPATPVSGGG